MDAPGRVRALVATTAIAAAAGTALALAVAGVPRPIPALGVLAGIAVLCQLFPVRLTEAGSHSSVLFLPVLTALVVVGPGGAALVAGFSACCGHLFRHDEPWVKGVFNTAQMMAAALAGGAVFLAVGGTLGGTAPLAGQLVPFLAAALTYFLVNRALVTTAVALNRSEPAAAVWRRLGGGMLPMDLTLALLSLLVARLHGAWGAAGLAVLLLPVFGSRLGYRAEGESRRASRDLLKLVVRSLEAQDPYTSGHSVRVAEASARLARALDLPAGEAEVVERAALLHDIGKIGAEYAEILSQEGRLSEEQLALIREHPDRGVEILRGVESLDPRVRPIVRHHHERWDGQGYPAGLAGEEIPLGARIVGICDAVDAMGSRRSYREALSVAEIRAELRRCSGSQFDPRMVEACLELGLAGELATGQRSEDRTTEAGRGKRPRSLVAEMAG